MAATELIEQSASTQEQLQQQQQVLESLKKYLEKDIPEVSLFGFFIDKFDCDESTKNVRIVFKNGNVYEGVFTGGTMDGVGRYQWSEGLSYHGTFQRNSLEGFGTYNWADGSSYEGDVKEGQCHGNGLMRLPNGQFFNGQWVDGKKEGMGTMSYDASGQECFSGEWSGEKRHGFGYYHYGPSSQAQYVGYWSNGCRHGAGSAVWPEQRQVYSGYWDRGVQQGTGRHIWAAERVTPAQYQLQNTYVGDWSSGQRHGQGTFNYAGGASYSGDWVDGVKHGEGKVTFKNGESYVGQFVEDRVVGGPGYIDISRTPDPRLFERQLSRKVDNDETLSALLMSCIPAILTNSHFNVERNDGSIVGPSDNNAELGQVAVTNCCTVLLRFASELRRIFSFYCDLGFVRDTNKEEQKENTAAFSSRSLMRLLWWRLIKDARIPFGHGRIESVAALDRHLAVVFPNLKADGADIHDANYPILFGNFLLWLAATALLEGGYGRPCYLNQDEPPPPASTCLERFLTEYILPNCCIVHGRLFASLDNATTALRCLPSLVQFYKKISDMASGDDDKTVSGRQLVAVIVAAGISQPTPCVRGLAGNVFLSAESDCTSYAFAELTPLEVGEALAEIAEFVNESLGGATDMVVRGSTSVIGDDTSSAPAPPPAAPAAPPQGAADHQTPTILGSILQESTAVASDGMFMIRGAGHRETTMLPFGSHPMGRIDWTNIIQHLLMCPDLADLPRLALRQQTLATTAGGVRAVSGLSSSERSATPQVRAPTDIAEN